MTGQIQELLPDQKVLHYSRRLVDTTERLPGTDTPHKRSSPSVNTDWTTKTSAEMAGYTIG